MIKIRGNDNIWTAETVRNTRGKIENRTAKIRKFPEKKKKARITDFLSVADTIFLNFYAKIRDFLIRNSRILKL